MNSSIRHEDFFSSKNAVTGITDADYKELKRLIEYAKSFERCAYQCIYIIDFHKKDFLYVSNNIAKLCGVDAATIKDLGYRFYIDYVPESDLKMLLEINEKGLEFLNEIPIAERIAYTISCDFHVKNGLRQLLVNHQMTPIVLAADGKVWLAQCVFSLAAGNKRGNIITKKYGSEYFHRYSLLNHKWIKEDEIKLTNSERLVLTLSSQGYTMNHIASIIRRSVNTVKAYKKSIFMKMKVKNIAEALIYAQNHRLI